MTPTHDEVVTHAHVRTVAVSGDRQVALITLDNGFDHTKPNTFGPVGLAELDAALDQVHGLAQAREIAAVALTGKPFNFCAGADLKSFRQMSSRDEVLDIARLGHKVFQRLGELGVPSFAFVNGLALGGGLEVALHCTYRTVSSG
ncbi:MAG: enoyl-CoA hydratase/isomerase family protein, partial [Actinomycetes bacterium]